MRSCFGFAKYLIALLALLAVLLAPVLPTQAAPLPPSLSFEGQSVEWSPVQPHSYGLHLLPGTHAHDYGNLRPLNLGGGQVITYKKRVDLSKWDVPVGDQGYVGSCVAWATTYSLAGWYLNKEGYHHYMAPMYTYHRINGGQDQGSWGYLGLDANMLGMVPQALYPQGSYDWWAAPTGTQMAIAHNWHINRYAEQYQSVYNQPGKNAVSDARYLIELGISRGEPELVELEVYDNMYNATAKTAWIGPAQGQVEGGHDLIAVGYDSQGLWVENQWGTGWGLGGYAELSWQYVQQAVEDTYVISGVSVSPHAPTVPVYHGAPALDVAYLNDGTARYQSALTNGAEAVMSARGFKPGEVVRLYWDGSYRGWLQAQPDGSWSIEQYDHSSTHIGPHNLSRAMASAGVHSFSGVGASGDRASVNVLVQ